MLSIVPKAINLPCGKGQKGWPGLFRKSAEYLQTCTFPSRGVCLLCAHRAKAVAALKELSGEGCGRETFLEAVRALVAGGLAMREAGGPPAVQQTLQQVRTPVVPCPVLPWALVSR